ncbi:basic salivary proline-rich protein 2-like [Rhinolophus ferrumequinum]|uniref:basic salivary proline-rich protein 2-like n=1 Tax=Rhinolophus ferrumequinum TaxID=59479 RepID=UPI00140F92B7|nr:basic salivary proline-rich protein 2-like [Rhinolophus ferrumequinum]
MGSSGVARGYDKRLQRRPGPSGAAAARLGPPPPPRLQHHPQRGKRKCFWRRSPGGAPEGLGFPRRRGLSTSSLLGIKPQCTTSFDHHRPPPRRSRPRGPLAPCACLPSQPSQRIARPSRLPTLALRGPPAPCALQPAGAALGAGSAQLQPHAAGRPAGGEGGG